ncbi:MAG: nucleotide exchange factor GrpE [bacterium]
MSDEQNIQEENKKNNDEQESQKEFEKDLELLEKKNQEYLSGWQRAKADYLNLKKESEKKYQDLIKFANAGLIIEMLPVLDNFKLALNHIPEDQKNLDWVVGMTHIKNQLEEILKNLGIEEIKTVGEKFNPELHEAVPAGTRGFDADNDADLTQIKGEEKKEGDNKKLEIENCLPAQAGKLEGEDGKGKEERDGIVTKEVRSGYTMHGKVIQPARVIVEN